MMIIVYSANNIFYVLFEITDLTQNIVTPIKANINFWTILIFTYSVIIIRLGTVQ